MTQKGFTLLEVMIVLVIMASLTIMSTRSIQQAIKSKEKIQAQVYDSSQVRDALRVLERDINLAFHYPDYEKEIVELTKKKRVELSRKASATTTTTIAGQPPAAPPPIAGIYNPNDPTDPLNRKNENKVNPTTHWIGKDSELYFATLNSSRIREGQRQADFVKVAYLLKSCRSLSGPTGNAGTSNCLIRRTSPIVEGDITIGGDNAVLLQNVTEFKLRYFGKGKQDWVSQWDSKLGDAVTKNRFPDAVEVSLTVEKESLGGKKKFSMQLVVPIRFSNNYAQDQRDIANRTNPGQTNQDQNIPGQNPSGINQDGDSQ